MKNVSLLALLLFMTACVSVKHEVEPIHVTIDVNVRIQEELDDFFGEVDRLAREEVGR